jgi:hypothetical protein
MYPQSNNNMVSKMKKKIKTTAEEFNKGTQATRFLNDNLVRGWASSLGVAGQGVSQAPPYDTGYCPCSWLHA